MKDKQKYCCLTAILALLIGAGAFVLFFTGILRLAPNALLPFVLLTAGGIWLLTLLSVTLAIPRSCALENAYRRCGNMAAASCGGLMLAALLTALLDCAACLEYQLLISICFFFLALTVGETVCFLYSYHRCQRACRDNCAYTGCRRPENGGAQCYNRCGCCPQPFCTPRNAGCARDGEGCSTDRFYPPNGSRCETADRSGPNSHGINERQNGCRRGGTCRSGENCSMNVNGSLRGNDCLSDNDCRCDIDCLSDNDCRCGNDCPNDNGCRCGNDCPNDNGCRCGNDCLSDNGCRCGNDCLSDNGCRCGNDCLSDNGRRCGNDCLGRNGYPGGNSCMNLNDHTRGNDCRSNGSRHGNSSHGNGFDGNPLCQDKEMF